MVFSLFGVRPVVFSSTARELALNMKPGWKTFSASTAIVHILETKCQYSDRENTTAKGSTHVLSMPMNRA